MSKFLVLEFVAASLLTLTNSNPVARKSFTFRSKNNNKIQGIVKLFPANGFEFVYAMHFNKNYIQQMS